jgi:uncharacterized membrane protein
MLYLNEFERIYPGDKPWAGDGFGMVIAYYGYTIMNGIAWVIALILTVISKLSHKKKMSQYSESTR